jgi:hypothetical protein
MLKTDNVWMAQVLVDFDFGKKLSMSIVRSRMREIKINKKESEKDRKRNKT